MKTRIAGSALCLLGAFLLASASVGCGKVGVPLPPLVRVPEPVSDLTAAQDGLQIVLSWTNPPRYIDGEPATDLASVRVFQNGAALASITATGAGQRQSYAVDVGGSFGDSRTFEVQVETRRGKTSAVSNSVSIAPVDVPGPVRNLRGIVDQFKIRLEWEAPDINAGLANAYIISRQDARFTPRFVTETFFEDEDFEPGAAYSYAVRAVRRADAAIPGNGSVTVMVVASDTQRPAPPQGLQMRVPNGFLTWEANKEADLEGYRIYRKEHADSDWTLLNPDKPRGTTSYDDSGYRPGFYYAVTAVDVFGNESNKSGEVRGQ